MTVDSRNAEQPSPGHDEKRRGAVRSPEYWPGPAYLALVLHVDEFYLADSFQYSRQSFHNRARLRNPDGWQWISVPLTGGQHGQPIAEAEINNSEPWQRKHWRALEYNYRSSPYFEYYEPRFAEFFDATWETLGALTCGTVALLAELLDCQGKIVPTSSFAEPPKNLLEIKSRVGNAKFLTLPDAADRDSETIPDLLVVHLDLPPYRQNFDGFELGMSTLDILFNHGPATRSMIWEASRVVNYKEQNELL